MTDPSKLYQQQDKHKSSNELDARVLAAAHEQASINAEGNKRSWNWMPGAATAAVLLLGITFAFNTDIFRSETTEPKLISESASSSQTFDVTLELDSPEVSFTADEILSEPQISQIQEIIVTGRHRSEYLEDVPASISEISESENSRLLEEGGLADISQESVDTIDADTGALQNAEEITVADSSESITLEENAFAAIASAPNNTDEIEEVSVAALIEEEPLQEAPVDQEISETASDLQLDEIIVTARKQERSFSLRSALAGLFSRQEAGPDLVEIRAQIPDIVLDIRYASSANFTGQAIDGYESPKALLSEPAADALTAVQYELGEQGLAIKIFDAYRPQRAVDHFIRWSQNDDESTKTTYYPNIEKSELFDAGYLAERSSHSRGSTVDLTIVKMSSDGSYEELDMGTIFDFFDPASWPGSTEISETAQQNRQLLRDLMTKHGFEPFETEWWHFTLQNEPYPGQYFDLPIE